MKVRTFTWLGALVVLAAVVGAFAATPTSAAPVSPTKTCITSSTTAASCTLTVGFSPATAGELLSVTATPIGVTFGTVTVTFTGTVACTGAAAPVITSAGNSFSLTLPTGCTGATFTEPVLKAWGLPYHLVETDDDVPKISQAYREAAEGGYAVAVLIGREYE